jgi:2-methylcitrate dehydratase PrpD
MPNAALANGTMGHALDYDDFGGFGHPTVAIFPSLLALGEKIGASGRDLLEAYVIGCELGIALDKGTKYQQMARGFHSTAVLGRIASAAACAKLLKFDQRQTATALGIAGSMAGGLIHNFGTMTKPLHAGMTARDGVMAAQLAGMGLTAGQQVLEHPVGFTNTIIGEGTYDLDEIAGGLGKPFRTQDDLMIKKYPACGGNHGMLDTILGLMREHKFDYRDVESLDVDQSFLSVVMLYREPEDELKGKFSVLYNAAAALVDGEVGVDTFTPEKIQDSRIQETMTKVNLNVRSRWDQGSAEVKGATPVRIRLKDGRVLEHATQRGDILGSQNNPWGMDSITGKFRVNARLALSDEAVERAIETWSDVSQVKDVGEAVKTLVA